MKSFKGLGKDLIEAGMDGAVLYGSITGFAVIKNMAKKVLPASIDPMLSNVVIAAVAAIGADHLLPPRLARLMGAVAAGEVIASFLDPIVQPSLIKAGMLNPLDVKLSTYTLPAPAPAAVAGYATRMGSYAGDRGMAGYASSRGMGGYGLQGYAMGNQAEIFPAVNGLGLAG